MRTISKELYIIVGAITLLIFLLGMSLGFIMDNARVKWVDVENKKQQINYESLQFQYLYLTSLEQSNFSCTVLQTTLDTVVSDLGYSLDRLVSFEKESKLNSDTYQLLRRQYLLDNIRYWFFSRSSKAKCGSDIVTVLYFYDEKCKTCPDQGVILSYFKKTFEEQLLVFPIDMTLLEDEPMLKVLKNVYKVEEYPMIVVDDVPYKGIVGRDALGAIICNSYKDFHEECMQRDWLNEINITSAVAK